MTAVAKAYNQWRAEARELCDAALRNQRYRDANRYIHITMYLWAREYSDREGRHRALAEWVVDSGRRQQ